MTSPNSDFCNYIADMRILRSHLDAAYTVAVGVYTSNPGSQGVPALDDLAQLLKSLSERVESAEDKAVEKFRDYLRGPQT